MPRITSKLNNEIDRTVRNFNQKISRLEKLNNENIIVPQKIKKSDLKNIESGRDLRRELNKLQRFSKRGAEQIVKTRGGIELSRWELNNLRNDRNTAIRRLEREVSRMENTSIKAYGKSLNITPAQIGNKEYVTVLRKLDMLKNRKIGNITDKKELERYSKLANVNASSGRDKVIRSNYISALVNVGYDAGVDNSILVNIEREMLKLENKDFVNIFNNDSGVRRLMYFYRLYRDAMKNGRKPAYSDDDVEEMFRNINENLGDILSNYG